MRSCVALIVLMATITAAPADGRDVEVLIEQARQENLAEANAWQDLLHFRDRRFMPGRRSATRDKSFFNAPEGWRDPQAELEATLRAFFRDPAQLGDEEQHPQCRFIARRAWLMKKLDLNRSAFPEVACERFKRWYESINPHEVTLTFAAAYLGNPASMYGHTLLRIDPPDQEKQSRLLSYAINHAAATQERSGLVFAVRGLTGGYPGLFSIMPYYEKVREYNGVESRDLWEYRLNLSPDEVRRLMQHAWELRGTAFPYYFLYQNCSYRLLGLLDVARPGLDLADRFSWWTIPTDTVREVLEQEDMLKEVVYRPAERTGLDHQIEQMTPEQLDWVEHVASGRRSVTDTRALDPKERGRVLEAAYDYLHFRQTSGSLPDGGLERMRALLVARSELAEVPAADDPPPPSTRPDEGHSTLRLGLGGGERGDAAFGSVHWRPAYHDALDPPDGYIEGANIAYGDVELRYNEGVNRIELERLMLIDIESLNPRSSLFQPWSWDIRAGLEHRRRPDGKRSLMAGAKGGGGLAWRLGDSRVWTVAGVRADAWGSDRLNERIRVGAGPGLDLLWLGELLRVRGSAEAAWYSDTSEPAWRLRVEQSVIVSSSLSVRFGVEREFDFGTHETSVQATVYGFF